MRRLTLLLAIMLTLGDAQTQASRSQDPKAKELRATDVSVTHDIDDKSQPFLVLEDVVRGTGLPAGVAQVESCSGSVTPVQLNVRRGTAVRDAMEQIVTKSPSFRWLADGQVINLIPASGLPLLDARVEHFELNTTDRKEAASAVLDDILRLPEIRRRAAELGLTPGIVQGGPGAYDEHPAPKEPLPVRVSLNRVSLRDAFNQVVRSYGHTYWAYSERKCKGSKTFVVTTGAD